MTLDSRRPAEQRDEMALDVLLDALAQSGTDTTGRPEQHPTSPLATTARRFHALAADDPAAPSSAVLATIWEDIMTPPQTIAPEPRAALQPAEMAHRRPIRHMVVDAARQRLRWPVTEVAVAAVVLLALATGYLAYRGGPDTPPADAPSVPAAALVGTPEANPPAVTATPVNLGTLLQSCPYPVASEIPGAGEFFFASGLGETPVWLVGWGNTSNGDVPFVGAHFAGPTERGWFMRALWAIAGGTTESVTLSGARVGDGLPLWFDILGQESGTTAVLDPAAPGIPVQHGNFREWPSSLYFPASGCYELEARWNGGSWRAQIPFVAPEEVPAVLVPPLPPDVPHPSECQVEPLPADNLLALLATPAPTPRFWVDRSASPPVPILPPDLPDGPPADDVTVAAVTGVWRERYACINAGDVLRAAALLSDEEVRYQFSRADPELLADEVEHGEPLPLGQRIAVPPLSEIRTLQDGRVGGLVDPGPAGDNEYAGKHHVIFVNVDGRWLIDTVVIIGG